MGEWMPLDLGLILPTLCCVMQIGHTQVAIHSPCRISHSVCVCMSFYIYKSQGKYER